MPCLRAKLASDFRSCIVVKTDAGAALPHGLCQEMYLPLVFKVANKLFLLAG